MTFISNIAEILCLFLSLKVQKRKECCFAKI